MMGATLPSLTRYLTQDGHLSKAFGRLYAANIIGAILGTLAAGFILIELLGLTGALAVGAGCSALGRRGGTAPGPAPPAARPRAPPTRTRPRLRRRTPVVDDPAVESGAIPRSGRVGLALTIAFVSGLTSLGYQTLWTRMLASGTGNTTYVFTVILALFLTGLAIGALLFNIVRPRLKDPARLLAAAQVLIGALVLFGLVFVIARPTHHRSGRPDRRRSSRCSARPSWSCS